MAIELWALAATGHSSFLLALVLYLNLLNLRSLLFFS
jgi:hypothetical protein